MAAHPNLMMLTQHAHGLRFLELLLVNSGLCAALLLNSALRIEANARCGGSTIIFFIPYPIPHPNLSIPCSMCPLRCRDLEWAAAHSPLQVLLAEFVADSSRQQQQQESNPSPSPSSISASASALASSSPSSECFGSRPPQDGGGGPGSRVSCAIYELLLSATSFWKVRDGLGC